MMMTKNRQEKANTLRISSLRAPAAGFLSERWLMTPSPVRNLQGYLTPIICAKPHVMNAKIHEFRILKLHDWNRLRHQNKLPKGKILERTRIHPSSNGGRIDAAAHTPCQTFNAPTASKRNHVLAVLDQLTFCLRDFTPSCQRSALANAPQLQKAKRSGKKIVKKRAPMRAGPKRPKTGERKHIPQRLVGAGAVVADIMPPAHRVLLVPHTHG